MTLLRNQVNPDRRIDIQGLRAVAVILVVLFHAGIPGFGGGYVGVDVFFVISGFLISTHLFTGLQDRGRIGFGAFYARRARRLLPAAFTVIALTVVVAAICVSPLQFGYVVRDAIAATFYVPNLWFAVNATDYLAETTPSLFMHYWSLGVEEQFYLLWPAVLLGLFKVFGLRTRMAMAIVGIISASAALCIWLTSFSQPNAFFVLFPRMWEFGLGALVALVLLGRERVFGERISAIVGWAGLVAVVASGTMFSTTTDYPGYAVALPVVGAAALIAAGAAPWSPAKLLSVRPLPWIGDISYSLYLVHWPLLMIPVAATAYMQPLPMWIRILLVMACVPLAWLLYTYVEQPGRRAPWLSAARPRRTGIVAASCMTVITATALALSALQNPVLNAGRTAPPTVIALNPVGTPFVPSNLAVGLTAVADDQPVTYANGCHRDERQSEPIRCVVGMRADAPLVVLFGDSHAAQWYPALRVLAKDGGIRLMSLTKSTCPAAQIEVRNLPSCSQWRRVALARIAAERPALILLGNRAVRYVANDDDPEQSWRNALSDTIKQFPAASRVGLFADTPADDATPTICLARYLDDAGRCALPRDAALYQPARAAERDLAAAGLITYLDFTDYLCNAVECPAILGNTVVYRDRHHIAASMSTTLAPVVDGGIMSILNGNHAVPVGSAG